jgi:outer membrane protein W
MHTSERLPSRGVAIGRLTAAVAAAIAVCLAGTAHAQSGKGDYVGRWSLAAGVGAAVPNTDEYADVLAWRLGVGYSRNPAFEVGLELGRFATEVSQPETDGLPTHDIASGRLEVLPVCLTVQYRAPLAEEMATLVLLAGAGYYFVDYTMAAAPREVFTSSGVEGLPDQAVRDAWGFHAGAGLEYALTGWFSVAVEGRYVFLAPQVSGTAKDDRRLGGSLDLNTWLFTGGIKVAF